MTSVLIICYFLDAVRTSKYGRASGGIIVFIKNSVSAGITRVLQDFEFAVSFELSSDFFSHGM